MGPFSRNKKKLKIYIIDDDQDARESLGQILLELYPAELWAFDSVDSCIAKLKTETVVPDVILSDVRMPSGSGFQLPHLLQEMGLQIPTIFVTGLGGEEINDGQMVVLSKPFSMQKIKAYVDKVLPK